MEPRMDPTACDHLHGEVPFQPSIWRTSRDLQKPFLVTGTCPLCVLWHTSSSLRWAMWGSTLP